MAADKREGYNALGAAIIVCMQLIFASCDQEQTAGDHTTSADFILTSAQLPEYERHVDHARLIEMTADWEEDWALRNRGTAIYRSTCYSCHGNNEQPGSLPDSKKFWRDTFKQGNDPYAMYQSITRGFGMMPPQHHLVPRQKYEVIAFIREVLIKPHNPSQYHEIDAAYLDQLPKGDTIGPPPQPYHPWSDMDYGNWLMRCYEMSDDDDPPKVISGGRSPLANEDYSEVNFAYKGIAMRLDPGAGGIAAGNTFAMFDHDLLRFVGAWTGEGFIDWEDILLDDQHNVYPRTVGRRQFANPITPGWANPRSGTFEDPRMLGADGRPFGPLPRSWAHYKGLYRFGDRTVIKYTVGTSEALETYDLEQSGTQPIISRTINLSNMGTSLRLRVAPVSASVTIAGANIRVTQEDGFHVADIPLADQQHFKIYMSQQAQDSLQSYARRASPPVDLSTYTGGSEALYPEVLSSPILAGNDDDPYAVDVLVLPQVNPWKSRMRPTGLDFLDDGKTAVVCTIDGEVWQVQGITQHSGSTQWKRIATGLFQPLGIKVQQGEIYVTCRDQLVRLHDLNDDGETDYYESFNNDHQVTEHFHEFAMGLQTDSEGNFYYAKSGRHARTSLVPQHGTLIKVSPDGRASEIIAHGFRAANGVCLNPDGSFYVTDQQGYWNPMNRINRVTKGGFYGNMWGYGAPEDTSDAAMIQPMCWIDMKYDRSPSELLWADSERWGPLNGSLLNLSYGYGKIFVVLTQKVGQIEQGGMIELPVPMFPTGIMRARFNPLDGQFYGCGMSAWATSRMIQVGGLYRVRYTGQPLHLPVSMEVVPGGLQLVFSDELDRKSATDVQNFVINTWDLKRTSRYGSDRYNEQNLAVSECLLSPDGKQLTLNIPDIQPTWVMEILYNLESASGVSFEGAIQNTIHQVPQEPL